MDWLSVCYFRFPSTKEGTVCPTRDVFWISSWISCSVVWVGVVIFCIKGDFLRNTFPLNRHIVKTRKVISKNTVMLLFLIDHCTDKWCNEYSTIKIIYRPNFHSGLGNYFEIYITYPCRRCCSDGWCWYTNTSRRRRDFTHFTASFSSFYKATHWWVIVLFSANSVSSIQTSPFRSIGHCCRFLCTCSGHFDFPVKPS